MASSAGCGACLPRCRGEAGSYGYDAQDAASFLDWQVDYVKVDFCGNATAKAGINRRDEITKRHVPPLG